ncbi:epidermal growth factor-like protein 7 [Corticium candelabrum]|uniref:epidermal growth factor-like protein 7 n=1 Tax=Corticium candelabrum TaxID=121492 RepID=UPI002E2738F1|nr:epidermal growth factor-like protein 7 [Corticium candelabrum]
MDYRLPFLAAIALAACFLSQSRAGPNECAYDYYTTASSRSKERSRYYSKCGWLNLSRCTRTRYYYYTSYYSTRATRQDCCSGWKKNSNGQCIVPICNPSCQHGGTCYHPNTCRCRDTDEFYGEKNYCNLTCPYIPKCKMEQCTSPHIMASVGNAIRMPVRLPSHTKCLQTERNVFFAVLG